MTENLQPLQSIGPVENSGEDPALQDPAKRDYLEGRRLYAEGNYGEAAQALHNALKGFEEQGDQVGIANACDRLGDVCLARERYALALENYQRAHAICEELEDHFSSLAVNKKMVMAHRKLGHQDTALTILFDMLEHYHLTSNPQGAVNVLEETAAIYKEMGRIQDAADAYRTIASIHANFKHRRKAEHFAEKARALEEK